MRGLEEQMDYGQQYEDWGGGGGGDWKDVDCGQQRGGWRAMANHSETTGMRFFVFVFVCLFQPGQY